MAALKSVIYAKRFITAFFVKAVFRPLAWLAAVAFDLVVVRAYRLYAKARRTSAPAGRSAGRAPQFIASRHIIHGLVLAMAVLIVVYNVFNQAGVRSSDELAGKTLLSRLVTQGSTDYDQLFEEYPNLDIARWRNARPASLGLLQLPISIYTNEKAVDDDAIAEEGSPSAPARTAALTYTVEPGDTISGIAGRFSISVNTILWENNLSATSLIKPGDRLVILPSTGVSHSVTSGQTLGQIARLYGIDEQRIMDANGIANPNQLRIGAKLVIPGGSRLASASSPSSRTTQQAVSGVAAIRNIISKPPAVVSTGDRWVWPTVGHRITQYYGWSHTGVDIANKSGTPIYAAEAGTVESLGYNRGGYGNQIIINHGAGKKTRYAHLSSFDVRTGQRVAKGEYIGAMGSTGRSTGPHLHFEVMINGQRYNPLNYVR